MSDETPSEPVDPAAPVASAPPLALPSDSQPKPDGKTRLGCLAGERFGDMIRVYRYDDSCNCSLDLENMDTASAIKVSRVLTALAVMATD